MIRSATSDFVVDYCSPVVQSSGAIGSAENWVKAFKGSANATGPLTLIINSELDPSFSPLANFFYQTDLRVRWSDDKGGGEAIIDAAAGVIVTVGGAWCEIEVNHKASIALGALPGADVILSVTGFVGTVPHPRPVRSQRIASLAAGATSGKLAIPRYTYLSRVETVPEISSQVILRGYQNRTAGAVSIQTVSGRNPLVNMSGIDFVDVENTSPIQRNLLVIHELSL
jgi:hypothetical protein